jgi:hypothetical protein
MRPLVVGERSNAGNVRRRGPGVRVTLGTTLAAVAVALAVVVAGCGSVSNGLPKNDGGAGGSAGSGVGGATGSGGAPGAGGAPGTGGAVTTTDAGADATADAPREGGAGCTGVQASCAALHACDATLASGNYMIAPDGPTDAAPVLVFCDMTLGGGWTVIYLADNINLNSTTIPYTVTSQKLRDNSTQALIAFRNLNLNLVASDTAVFDLPAAWRASNPLTATPPQDLTLSASVNGGLPAVAKLRYGVANFGSLCGDDWNTVSNYGRICLQDTAAAFYSGFSTTAGDFCALSTNAYSSRACSDMIRFSIAVR